MACRDCHDNEAGIAADLSPAQIAGISDDDLINVFTMGVAPPGYAFTSNLLKFVPDPDCVFHDLHHFERDDDAALHGLVWKLRSITPRPY